MDVDYERAGHQLYTLIVCTAPVPRREELAEAAVDCTELTVYPHETRQPGFVRRLVERLVF